LSLLALHLGKQVVVTRRGTRRWSTDFTTQLAYVTWIQRTTSFATGFWRQPPLPEGRQRPGLPIVLRSARPTRHYNYRVAKFGKRNLARICRFCCQSLAVITFRRGGANFGSRLANLDSRAILA
jgi:hypothetical protein